MEDGVQFIVEYILFLLMILVMLIVVLVCASWFLLHVHFFLRDG